MCTFLLLTKLQIEFLDTNFILRNSLSLINTKLLIILFGTLLLLPIWRQFNLDHLNIYEFFTYFLLSLLALLLLFSAHDLILIYILLEMQTLVFVTLASIKRNSVFATEAGLKYFILGAFFSGLYLLGSSILYGILGSINFQTIGLLLFLPMYNSFLNNIIFFAVLLITIVFLFKLAVAPFHFWAPDVYEGSPLPTTMLISTLPKIVIITLLIKWVSIVYNVLMYFGSLLFLILGILSILTAIMFAQNQKRVKRFIAFSSIGQIGYMTLLFAIPDFEAYINIYFFIIIYISSSITLWYIVSIMNTNYLNNQQFLQPNNFTLYMSNFANINTSNAMFSLFLLIIISSLAGLPPFAGFLPKLFVFNVLMTYEKYFIMLLLIGITCVVIWYYINFLIYFFMEVKPSYKKIKRTINMNLFYNNSFLSLEILVTATLSIFLLYFFFKPNSLLLYSNFCISGILL